MMKTGLLSIAGTIMLGAASAAIAQGAPSSVPTGGPRSQDIAASNRQFDSDYNTLAGRGVKVTDKSREDSRAGAAPRHGSVVPATAADIKAGAPVRDVKGVPLGKIATLASNEVVADPTQAVIDTGQTKIGVPLIAFGRDDKGLLLSITAEKFNQLVAQAHASAQASKSN